MTSKRRIPRICISAYVLTDLNPRVKICESGVWEMVGLTRKTKTQPSPSVAFPSEQKESPLQPRNAPATSLREATAPI